LVDESHNYKHQTVCDERIKPPHLFTEQEKIAVETCPVKLKINYSNIKISSFPETSVFRTPE
jgi:hypothetical protein